MIRFGGEQLPQVAAEVLDGVEHDLGIVAGLADDEGAVQDDEDVDREAPRGDLQGRCVLVDGGLNVGLESGGVLENIVPQASLMAGLVANASWTIVPATQLYAAGPPSMREARRSR